MEIRDEHVPEYLSAEFTTRMQLVCLEIVLDAKEAILLAKRTNEPLKGEWF